MSRTATIAALALVAGAAAAQPQFTFQRIAGTGTVVPGDPSGSLENVALGSAALDLGQVAFVGLRSLSAQDIYLFDGNQLGVVALTGGTAPFLSSFRYDAFDSDVTMEVGAAGATVGFEALDFSDPNSGREVVVTQTEGVATNRADSISTVSPSNGAVFAFIDEPAISGGSVVFRGETIDPITFDIFDGIYTDLTGPLTTVVDENTPVPGLPEFGFTSFDQNVAFDDTFGIEARFSNGPDVGTMILTVTPDGVITDIANSINTPNPSTGVRFGDVDGPDVSGSHIVFGGSDIDGAPGIYADFGAGLIIIADLNTPVPGQLAAEFSGFSLDDLSIEGRRIVFRGIFSNGTEDGVYLWDDGILSRVVDSTQAIGGQELSILGVRQTGAISGDQIAFGAGFDDGSTAIYLATSSSSCSAADLA
ncbi:MAG: hypothetical protein AAFU70_00175, partial [Planctomycetota bacterium]